MRLLLKRNKFKLGVGMAMIGLAVCIVTAILGIVFNITTMEGGILPYLIVFGIGAMLIACSLIFTLERSK